MAAPVTQLPVESGTRLPIGVVSGGGAEVTIDLDKLLSGRLLIQGSSGAGKSRTLRRLIEEAFEFVTVMIVDPEAEFENLAAHIGATTIRATEMAPDSLTAAALRARHNRLPLHLDLSDLSPDERIRRAAGLFAGLVASPREDWAHTVMVAIDEAHLLAPHLAASARDAEARSLGVAALTDLCARGRKRGLAPVVATQRLAKLAGSVVSELHNALIGINVFDRDIARASDILGFSRDRANELRSLRPGEFYALGPALAMQATLTKIGPTSTEHIGATPEIVGPAFASAEEAEKLLQLDSLRMEAGQTSAPTVSRGGRALDTFLLEPDAEPAVRIVAALRNIAPNATTSDDLERHLGIDSDAVNAGLDLLSALGAVDTVPRGDARIARLSAKLRLRVADTPVVGLA